MTAMLAFLKRHPVLTYFTLTFAIGWGGVLMVVGPDGLPITAETFETTPMLAKLAWLAGPSVAGIVLTVLVAGRTGLRELLSGLTRWRVGARWYGVALLAAPLVTTAVRLALSLFSHEFHPVIFTSDDLAALLLSSLAAGLMVGLLEELGWTGFAIPRMKRRYGVLGTGLFVGALWGAYHFLFSWRSDSFADALPLIILLASLFSWLPAYRLLMVWVYDHTESLLVAVVMHVSLVVSQLILTEPLAGVPLLTSILAGAAAWWVIVAAVAVASHGQFLRRPAVEATA
jgi:membrane protease YdiL (CAAX protease family)